ncbi:hypothetical protein CDD81_7768 [Ophiocordyceps australis]|uniref:Uncharacterized protein n=1 Tax=Ophiocordyceps australis TaxID=1399860 RepID=A0A2C5Y4M5_9HYPO|nr:hypothetical protein CDD81_7768 [Ophiocordyceps australis]
MAPSPLARPVLDPFPVPGAAQPTPVCCSALHVANPDRSGLDSPHKAAQSGSWPVLPAASTILLVAPWLCSSPTTPLHNQASAQEQSLAANAICSSPELTDDGSIHLSEPPLAPLPVSA